jgi:hypothetical protein
VTLTATLIISPGSPDRLCLTLLPNISHQQDSNIRAGVTGGTARLPRKHGRPAPASPPRKRHGLPDRQPSHHRTRLPGQHRPGKSRAAGRTHRDARPTRRQTSSPNPPGAGHRNPVKRLRTAPWPRFPSAMRPWTLGSWALEIHGRDTDGEGGSGYADRGARFLASDLATQDACALLSSSSSPGPVSVSVVSRASVMRWLAASARPSIQCAWILSRTATPCRRSGNLGRGHPGASRGRTAARAAPRRHGWRCRG